MNTTTTHWLIWIVAIYLAIGCLFLAFWWVFAVGQGGSLTVGDALRALFGWPYWLIVLFVRG